ncbi:alanine/ornithine racemase family PLP-dependent enzyme [Crassaminicella thermophila]|uniref:Alanine/ornithine racemase family PLP-dependent enzyme n=1 Tax=Crassaminicella thermophila TaxID=2599308 RepID=A0A5C0SL23_CRATE|nr:alanine/ornithine racemase family PLP-dependent enzyme [Crassaminicella thermophila]
MCPRVEVNLSKIRHNTRVITKLCSKLNIQVAGVTKVFCAMPEIVQAMIDGGIEMLADSRIENLKKLDNFKIPKILLRLPMKSQAMEVIKYADISLNSELATIEELSRAARKEKKIHNIILMIDLGDLREGVWKDKILDTVKEILKLDQIKLIGIGTNLTCYGGVIPDNKNLGMLVEISNQIEKEFNISLEIISGGNSSSLYLIEKGEMPKKINHLRLGEAIVLGRETAYGHIIKNTFKDAFTFVAEIIELKEKPSVPIGEIGLDAFGNKPTFTDNGIRKRAILAVGRQDVLVDNITPFNRKIKILGASSDHLIIDVTDCEEEYAIGDEIRFQVEYGALLQLMTSGYVYKEIQ